MAKNNLVPLKSIMVVRDGKRVSPPIGKAYPFTDEEVKVLKESVDYRKAVNEDEEASDAEVKAERNSVGHKKPGGGANNGAPASAGAGTGGGDEGDPRLKANAADMIASLDEITDKADLAALKASETTGKNRSTVLAAIDARVAALTTDDDL